MTEIEAKEKLGDSLDVERRSICWKWKDDPAMSSAFKIVMCLSSDVTFDPAKPNHTQSAHEE